MPKTFSLPNPQEKQIVVQNMFTSAAKAYDLNNSVLSFGMHHLWKRIAISILDPKPGQTVVDLCGGTADLGLLAKERVGPKGIVATVDLNFAMLRIGLDKIRSDQGRSGMGAVQSNAEVMAIRTSSVDRLVVGFGLRNVTNLDVALKDIYRILKPGGRFVCLEFSTPVNSIWDKLYRFYSFAILPLIGRVVSGDKTGIYEYLPASIAKFPEQERFKGLIEAAGFRNVAYRNLSGGIVAIHSGEKPHGAV
ncbi:MAG: class I SAM-dependent methyltransferase [Leptospirillum sp.]|jgi:demethylmenaquinone methyltransferase/2-methoxy-6-polyprenyl-1,4-benzoquinol methylase